MTNLRMLQFCLRELGSQIYCCISLLPIFSRKKYFKIAKYISLNNIVIFIYFNIILLYYNVMILYYKIITIKKYYMQNKNSLWLLNIQYSFCKKIKQTRQHKTQDIRIYTGAFKTSPVESSHVEAHDPLLKRRRNELGLRFLYKLKSNSSYIETLNTLDNNED